MNCTDIRGMLSAYLDGEATPEEHKIVEEHLASCRDCRRVLAQYRAIGGGMRALAVPVPPAGLRRDVWRAIEAQQSARGATGAVSVGGAGKVTPIDRARERAQGSVTNINTRKGWSIGKLLPAAGLVAAMLVLFAVVLIANRNVPVAAAALLDKAPDYNAPVHVRFSKPVDGSYAEMYTQISRLDGDTFVPVTDVLKTYDNSTLQLTISPKSPWVRGATYEVSIDAPRISTGVQGGYLGKDPVKDTFKIAVLTATRTNSPTQSATSTATTVPPSATATPVVVAIPPTEVVIVPPDPGNVTPAASDTPQPQATATRVPPTATVAPSHTPQPTATATQTPEPATATTTLTPKATVTQTPRATSTVTVTQTPKATGTPKVTPTVTPTVIPCGVVAVNGFGKLWRENSDVRSRLGCATAEEWGIINAAEQHFQGGYMFWNGDTRTVYVFVDGSQGGTFYFFADTWTDGDPTAVPVGTPPAGLYQPVRGFGKIWSGYPGLRQALGWATDQEAGVQAAWQPFAKGNMLWTGDRRIRVMYDEGVWSGFEDTFNTPTPVANRPMR